MSQRIGCWLASPIAILRDVLLVLSLLLAQGAVPPGEELLLQAERAYVAGDFQKVGWGCQSLPLPLSGAVLALLWALSLRRRSGSSGG